ncbi:TrmH family RNA methyltransferase [Lactococcus termiticola]|uniref:rRNA methyltransferase n=1 Tax=Lactococcus termiticola TaxID=2169526 RepID=A0A2R5HFY9_9LACT|nr:RNA methyltransferase [Lactococcus termiticola]GBG96979.1 rRNA methyltransferase [Lactococcus termiticola]
MEVIRSKDNVKIKSARKLLTKKGRKQAGSYLIEGFHLLQEAIGWSAELEELFVSEEKIDQLPAGLSEYLIVSNEVLASLSDAETPQGLVAVVKQPQISFPRAQKVLLLENVQDPGNVGTMIRTADAAGFSAVLCLKGTADIYSPKVVRSMQGSQFHLPVIDGLSLDEALPLLKDLTILTTTLSKDSISHREVQADNFALIMGNEGAGVSEAAIEVADQLVHIEMPGHAESLNVAVAAGILMFSL